VIPVTLQIAVPGAILQVATALVGLVASTVRRRRGLERGQLSCSWRVSLEIHRVVLTAEARDQDRQPPVDVASEGAGRAERGLLVRLPAPN